MIIQECFWAKLRSRVSVQLIFAVLLLYVGAVSLMAQEGPEIQWEKTFGGEFFDSCESVQQTTDGGYILVGGTRSFGAGSLDVYLIKTDEAGNIEWEKTFGGSEYDLGNSVQQTADGGYVIAGQTMESFGEVALALIYVIKVDASGNIEWDRTYSVGDGNYTNAYGNSVQQTADGGYVIAGETIFRTIEWDPIRQVLTVTKHKDACVLKLNTSGSREWDRIFGGSAHDDYGTSLIRLEDGTYLIGGIGNGMLLSRVDQEGNLLWRRSLVGEGVYGSDGLTELEDGGYLVAGFIQIVNGRSYDAIILRTDSEGQLGEVQTGN